MFGSIFSFVASCLSSLTITLLPPCLSGSGRRSRKFLLGLVRTLVQRFLWLIQMFLWISSLLSKSLFLAVGSRFRAESSEVCTSFWFIPPRLLLGRLSRAPKKPRLDGNAFSPDGFYSNTRQPSGSGLVGSHHLPTFLKICIENVI